MKELIRREEQERGQRAEEGKRRREDQHLRHSGRDEVVSRNPEVKRGYCKSVDSYRKDAEGRRGKLKSRG